MHTKLKSPMIGNCPACSGLVRIPFEAKADAQVRCPHCGQTFAISMILEQIPELEIIGPQERSAPTKPLHPIDLLSLNENQGEHKKFVIPSQLIAGAKRNRRKRRGSSSSETIYERKPRVVESPGRFNETVATNPSNVVAATADPLSTPQRLPSAVQALPKVRVHSSQRQRRMKEIPKNPIAEGVKIVAGGLVAFPIAYLILMWVVGQDPLKLGPSTGRVVPFLVPKTLRTEPFVAVPKATQEEPEASQEEPEASQEESRSIFGQEEPEPEIMELPDFGIEDDDSN